MHMALEKPEYCKMNVFKRPKILVNEYFFRNSRGFFLWLFNEIK